MFTKFSSTFLFGYNKFNKIFNLRTALWVLDKRISGKNALPAIAIYRVNEKL